MANYSFKINDPKIIKAIDAWQEAGYTVRGMIEYLVSKDAGLELPKPNDIQLVNIELRELRKKVEIFEQNEKYFAAIVTDLIADVEHLKVGVVT